MRYTVPMKAKRGFTIVELLTALVLIALLSTLLVISLNRSRAKSKLSRVSVELGDMAKALSQYAEDNNYQYPADVSRGMPPGLEKYLAGGVWPTSVWPHGLFDWENWTWVADHNGNQVQQAQPVYQISYRLCGASDPVSYCQDPAIFPHFAQNSSIFYCISGNCVPHQSSPFVPGYWVNHTPHEVNPPL